jgi:uncharacterized small protein (DUF1192 family)
MAEVSRRGGDVANDLGGLDLLSEGQKQLIRRAATLSAESERLEAEWANGRNFDLTAYSTTANCLRRIFESLGLKRVARPVESIYDYLSICFAKLLVPLSFLGSHCKVLRALVLDFAPVLPYSC